MKKVSKEDIYLAIMERYPGVDMNQIADWNPYQQYVALRGPKIVTVDSYEEVLRLQQQRRR